MKRITIMFAIIAIVVVAWTGGWAFVAREITRTATALAEISAPTQAYCIKADVAGFPFRFDLTCTNATLVDGDISLQIPEVKLTALVYKPTHLIAFAKGPMRYTDAFFGTHQELRWDAFEASLRLDGWKLARLSATITAPEFVDRLLGEHIIGKAQSAEMHLLDRPTQQSNDLAIAFSAKALGAPHLTITNGEITLDALLSHMPDDVRTLAAPQTLRAWQQVGGALIINTFAANDNAANMSISGTLSLDDEGAPQGDLTAQSVGMVERLSGLIDPNLLNTILGNKQTDGSYRQILTIRRGAVVAGFLPLFVLPALF